MTSTKTAKPNKALRALIEQHPEQTKTILDGGPAVIQFLNAWANVYAKNPDEARAFYEGLQAERQAAQAEASAQHA